MSIQLVFTILAIVSFLLAAARVPGGIDWTPLGFAFVTMAVLLPIK